MSLKYLLISTIALDYLLLLLQEVLNVSDFRWVCVLLHLNLSLNLLWLLELFFDHCVRWQNYLFIRQILVLFSLINLLHNTSIFFCKINQVRLELIIFYKIALSNILILRIHASFGQANFLLMISMFNHIHFLLILFLFKELLKVNLCGVILSRIFLIFVYEVVVFRIANILLWHFLL